MIETNYAYSALNLNIISVINTVEFLNLNITRKTIRKYFLKIPSYPQISLFDICKAFEEWNIDTITSSIPNELLFKAPLPFIACIQEDQELCFVLITNINLTDISYIHPRSYLENPNEKRITKVKIESFLETWNKTVILFLYSEKSGETNFKNYKDCEIIEKNEYSQKVIVIDNFITDIECDEIILQSECNNLYQRSKVGEESVVSNFRTSYSAKLEEHELPILENIINEACNITKLSKNHLEKLQTARYEKGQKFTLHFDTAVEIVRRYTGIIYLNVLTANYWTRK